MRCLAFGYMTIDQIEKSSYEIEDTNFRKSLAPLNIHPYECYVQSDITIIGTALFFQIQIIIAKSRIDFLNIVHIPTYNTR